MVKEISKKEFDEYVQKYIVSINEEYNVPKEEVSDFFKKRIERMPDSIKDDNRKVLVSLKKMALMFFKKVGGASEDYEVVFIGETKITDYGMTKVIEEAEKSFKTDEKTAIAQGLTNDKGQPLYIKGNNAGKPIDKENIYSKDLIGIVNDGGKARAFKFTCRKGAVSLDIPFFKKVKINGYKSSKEDPKWKFSGSVDDTKFEVLSDEYVDIEKYKDLFKEEFNCNIEELAKDKKNYTGFFIMKASVVKKETSFGIGINFTPFNISEVPTDDDLDMGFSEETTTKEYFGIIEREPSFTETSQDAWVIGKPYEKNDGSIGANIFAVWVQEADRTKEVFNNSTADEIKSVGNAYSEPKGDEPKKETPKATPKADPKKDADTDW